MTTLRRFTPFLVVLLGFALRLLIILSSGISSDAAHFAESARIFAAGGNIYVVQPYYNYSPALGIVLAALTHLPLPFDVAWRLFLSCVTLATAFVVSRLVPRQRLLVFAVLWLSPAALWFDGYWAQSDLLALLPLLLAVVVAKYSGRAWLFFALCLLSVLLKQNVVFFVWALFVYQWGVRRAVLRMIALAALFALSFTPYLPAGLNGILTHVAGYQSWVGVYGLSLFLPAKVAALLFFAVMLGLPLLTRRLPLNTALGLSGLAFFVFTYGISNQTFILLLPLMALVSPLTLLVAALALLPVMVSSDVSFMAAGLLVWLTCAGLFTVEVYRGSIKCHRQPMLMMPRARHLSLPTPPISTPPMPSTSKPKTSKANWQPPTPPRKPQPTN